jgi:hypothetical protein
LEGNYIAEGRQRIAGGFANYRVQVIIVKYHCYPVPCTESLVSYQDKGISGKRIFHIAVAIGKKASELIAPE